MTYHPGPALHVLDWVFVSDLISNPEPLWGCDNATILALGEGGFKVQDARRGELLHELGLRDGDVILSLNKYELLDYEDVGMAFIDLWYSRGETDYTLEIERGSRVIELNYHLALF